MRIAVLGARGLLGTELVCAARTRAFSVDAWDLPEHDIRAGAEQYNRLAGVDWMINCAAYTDVDGAEIDRQTAFAVNAEGVAILSGWCAARGIPLLHIGTDYVFDGRQARPYREDDDMCPLNAYGASKAEGERRVRESGAPYLLVRTQSLFGRAGRNFVRTLVSRLQTDPEPVPVVNDQRSSPTYAGHLAQALLELLGQARRGTVHVAADGACTWYELALEIAAALGVRERVTAVSSADFPRPARRPANSVLDTSRFREWTGRGMPTWREGLSACLDAMAVRGEAAGARRGPET